MKNLSQNKLRLQLRRSVEIKKRLPFGMEPGVRPGEQVQILPAAPKILTGFAGAAAPFNPAALFFYNDMGYRDIVLMQALCYFIMAMAFKRVLFHAQKAGFFVLLPKCQFLYVIFCNGRESTQTVPHPVVFDANGFKGCLEDILIKGNFAPEWLRSDVNKNINSPCLEFGD
jgi:hypothetical protein